VGAGGYMTLAFPAGVDLGSTSLGCDALYGFASSGSVACVQVDSQTLRVAAFPNSDQYMLLQVQNFLVPAYVSTFTVTVTTYTSTNAVVDASQNQIFSFTTTPGNLQMSLA